jgi:hypothetical protein
MPRQRPIDEKDVHVETAAFELEDLVEDRLQTICTAIEDITDRRGGSRRAAPLGQISA